MGPFSIRLGRRAPNVSRPIHLEPSRSTVVARPVACNTRGVAGSVLLERDRELAELAQAAREAAAGEGGLVLVSGEAGIGKSSLVRAVRGLLPAEGRLLVGHCDDLATPRTLGPFRDLVGQVGAELTRALAEGGDRDAVLAALRPSWTGPGTRPSWSSRTSHWADEATLDVLRYLVRRIADLPAVLVLTYRDDELTREHPLQRLLGQASASGRVRRLPLRRLSADAVRQLSAASRVDADEVFAVTSGNPFFVTEVLAAGRRRPRPAPRSSTRCWPGCAASTRPPRMRWSSWPWSRPWWSGGWSTRSCRAGWPRWRRPRSTACSRCRRPRWRSGTSSPGGPWRTRCRWRAGWSCNRRVLHALVGREDADLCPHRPPRGSGRRQRRDRPATGRRRPGTRPAPAPTGRRSPTTGWCSVTGSGSPRRAGRAAGAVRRRVLHDRDRRGHARRPARGGRAAPVTGRPARARGGPALAVPDGLVGRGPGGRRARRARRRSPCWSRPATAGCSPWPSATSPSCTCWPTAASDCVAVGERAIALAREVGDAAILSHALTASVPCAGGARRSGGHGR